MPHLEQPESVNVTRSDCFEANDFSLSDLRRNKIFSLRRYNKLLNRVFSSNIRFSICLSKQALKTFHLECLVWGFHNAYM
jgi:hypothetical protein